MPNRPSTSGRQHQSTNADAALTNPSPRQRKSSAFDTRSGSCDGPSSCNQQQPKHGSPQPQSCNWMQESNVMFAQCSMQQGAQQYHLQQAANHGRHSSSMCTSTPASPGQGQGSRTRRDCHWQASSSKHVTPRNSMPGPAFAARQQQQPCQEAVLLHCQDKATAASSSWPQSTSSLQPHMPLLKAPETVNPLYINSGSTALLQAALSVPAAADQGVLAAATAYPIAAAAEASSAEAEQQSRLPLKNLPATPQVTDTVTAAAAARVHEWQVWPVQPGCSGQLQEPSGRGVQLAAGVLTQDPAHSPGSCKAASCLSSSSTRRPGSRNTQQGIDPSCNSKPSNTSRPSTTAARPFRSAAGGNVSALGYASLIRQRQHVIPSPSVPGQAPGSPRRPRSSISLQQQQQQQQQQPQQQWQQCTASGPLLSDYFRPPSAAAPGSIRLSGLPGALPPEGRATSAPSLKLRVAKSSWDASLAGISSRAGVSTASEQNPCSGAGESDDGAVRQLSAGGSVGSQITKPDCPASGIHQTGIAGWQQQQQQYEMQQPDDEMLVAARQHHLGPEESNHPAQQLLLWSAAHEIDGRPATRTGGHGRDV